MFEGGGILQSLTSQISSGAGDDFLRQPPSFEERVRLLPTLLSDEEDSTTDCHVADGEYGTICWSLPSLPPDRAPIQREESITDTTGDVTFDREACVNPIPRLRGE